jgi:hypothetical protein
MDLPLTGMPAMGRLGHKTHARRFGALRALRWVPAEQASKDGRSPRCIECQRQASELGAGASGGRDEHPVQPAGRGANEGVATGAESGRYARRGLRSSEVAARAAQGHYF